MRFEKHLKMNHDVIENTIIEKIMVGLFSTKTKSILKAENPV